MKLVEGIVYRYLTKTDYFNIYKPSGVEAGGGGQTYIDIPATRVSIRQWRDFLRGVPGAQLTQTKNGPDWRLPINSIGLQEGQQMSHIYQRRGNTVIIANQNTNTRGANRISAWLPENGFPEPADPRDRGQLPAGLAIFLVRTADRRIWAGWLLDAAGAGTICRDQRALGVIRAMIGPANSMVSGASGIIVTRNSGLMLDETDVAAPFLLVPARIYRQRPEAEMIASLFAEDVVEEAAERAVRRRVTEVRQRNERAVRTLKELYRYQCQLTGDAYTFLKADGTTYCEAHHLIPLGEGGADDPRNIIIVSPLVHSMLHYAAVTGVDLSRIVEGQDGTATLVIQINGEDYTITWRRGHAQAVLAGARQARS